MAHYWVEIDYKPATGEVRQLAGSTEQAGQLIRLLSHGCEGPPR